MAPLSPDLPVAQNRSNEFLREQLVEAWLQGRSPDTVRAYRGDLEAFGRWRALEPTAALDELLAAGGPAANGIVFQWRATMLEEGRSPSTVNRRLAALRSVVALARLVGRVPWSLEVRGVKAEVLRDTRGPAPRAVRRVRRLLEVESRSRRDTALLRLLADVGLRRAEILSLDLEHVDTERGGVWVLRKGKRQRTWLDLPAAAAAAIGSWVGERGSWVGALFVRQDRAAASGRQRLTGAGLYGIVRSWGAQTGAVTSPHRMRHFAITQAMVAAGEMGIPIEEVLGYSGHSPNSLAVLMRYRDNLGGERRRLAEAVSEKVGGPSVQPSREQSRRSLGEPSNSSRSDLRPMPFALVSRDRSDGDDGAVGAGLCIAAPTAVLTIVTRAVVEG